MQQTTQTDIYSSFHVFYRILRCLGIVPYSFDSSAKQFTFQTKYVYLGAFILFFLISSQAFFFSHCKKRLAYFLTDLLIGVDATVMFALLLIYLKLGTRKIMTLLSKIDTFDKNIKFSYSNDTQLKKCVFLNCFHFSLMLVSDLIYMKYSSRHAHGFCLSGFWLAVVKWRF